MPSSEAAMSASASETTLDRIASSEQHVGQRRLFKNIIVISLAFMIQFTAYQGTVNLQSSLNSTGGLGTASLATIYVAIIISSFFLPALLIKWLGCKWTVSITLLMYMPYIAAHFHADWYTLVPAAAVEGLSASPLWVSSSSYIRLTAIAYCKGSDLDPDAVTSRFFGIFYMVFQFSQVWGNLISSTVFSMEPVVNNYIGVKDWCGSNYKPGSSEAPPIRRPSVEKIYTVVGIYLGCMGCAFLIMASALDQLPKDEEKNDPKNNAKESTGIQLIVATLKLLKNPTLLLLLPLTMHLGVSQAFIGADYTSSFVACGWGINNIGYVMICYGICNAIVSMTAGWIVKHTGRIPVLCFAAILQLGVATTLLIWKPHSEDRVLYFVMSGLWGMCDATWIVQGNSIFGIMFPNAETAAYSNFRIWEGLGYIIAYAYSAYLVTYVKLYILICFCICGLAGYLTAEIRRRIKTSKDEEGKIVGPGQKACST